MRNSFRQSPLGSLILPTLAAAAVGGMVYLRYTTRPTAPPPISHAVPSAPSGRAMSGGISTKREREKQAIPGAHGGLPTPRSNKPGLDDDDDREPHPDNPGAAIAFRKLQWRDENGYIPPDGLIRAKEHVDAMRRANPGAAQAQSLRRPVDDAAVTPSNWTWLGPGNIGGRVRSIVVNPTTPTTWLAGSVSGGIWQTANSGGTWAPLDDFMANLAVSTMVMKPGTPSTIYAGTGEGFYSPEFEFTSAIQGDGIFKSTDGGATWSQLASTNNSTFYYVNRLAMSPDATTLLAATEYGVSRSINGGTAFTSTAGIGEIVTDLAFHPTNSSLAVASGYSGDAWYSTNGGVNWTAATGLPSGGGRVEIAYAPSAPTIVYASADYNGGAMYMSSDGGATYAALASSPPSYLGSQGWYADVIWVDPVDSITLVVGGVDLWRTTNGGASWSQISNWQFAPNSAHADHHAIVSLPGFNGTTNTTVIFGDDGGIYSTSDVLTVGSGGNHESGWAVQNHNLGITQFYGAAGNPATGVIAGGTQDNGTLAYTPGSGSGQGPQGYQSVFGGDGGYTVADTAGNYFYGEYVYLQVVRSAGGAANSGLYIDGLYWNGSEYVCLPTPYSIPDVCSGTNISVSQANFIAPLLLDPNNPQTLLAGGASLWRTTNARQANTSTTGPSWASIKAPFGSASNFISAIAVAQGNSNLCWVGYDDGSVFKTTNCAAGSPTWTRVNSNGVGLPSRYVTRVTIDPTNNNRVYVSLGGFTSNNIWVTTNGGNAWTASAGNGSTGLPSVPVRDLAIDPGDPLVLYAGTEVGVFTSLDGGNTWEVPQGGQDGPANVSVDQLFWMGNSLVAATWGRGLFEASAIESDFGISVTQSSQTVTQGSSTTYTVNTSALGALAQTVTLSASGLPTGATSSFNPLSVTAGSSSTLTINTVSSTPAGTVTLTVTGTGVVPTHLATTSLTVNASAPAALAIAKSHVGSFAQSQTGATYSVTVSNGASAGPTNGTVTVAESVPAGLTLVSMSGTGWTCPANGTTCTTTSVLAAGASYSPIIVTVNVASSAAASVINQVSVSGGGSATANASDPTTIVSFSACDVNQDSQTNVSDVQLVIDQALGLAHALNSLNNDGVVNVVDVQIVSNAVLGRGCSAP